MAHSPFSILWALREAPNDTTNVPPWLMAFGRLPRGPLSILKDTWTGTEELPFNLGKGTAEYLQDLTERFNSVQTLIIIIILILMIIIIIIIIEFL